VKKKAGVISFVFLLLLMTSAIPFPSSAQKAPSPSPAVAYPSALALNSSPSRGVGPAAATELCSIGSFITGVFAGPNGGVFVLDQLTGNLLWCKGGVSTVIATPPGGSPSAYWYGMGGVKTTLGTVLVANIPSGGFYLCFGATPNGCSIESTFIDISGFCATTAAGSCGNQGVTIDKKLNVYIVDELNYDIIKCTYASAYKTCSVIEPASDFAGGVPIYIYIDPSGNIWVSDYSSSGYVWKNGAVHFTLGTPLYGITGSTKNPTHALHIYVGVISFGIKDLNDKKFIVTGSDTYTITTALQYGAWSAGTVYKTSDKA
jgi:hypothetical protein